MIPEWKGDNDFNRNGEVLCWDKGCLKRDGENFMGEVKSKVDQANYGLEHKILQKKTDSN